MIGGIGAWEIIIIAVALLVLFGAKRLPDIGKSLGKGLREFKKATNEITSPIKDEIDGTRETFNNPMKSVENTVQPDSESNTAKSEVSTEAVENKKA